MGPTLPGTDCARLSRQVFPCARMVCRISFHPITSARCSSVSGERLRPSGVPRRRSAIRVSASLPSRASCSTSQQPITVPVRPIPPQQWTYDGVPAETFTSSWREALEISGPRHPQVRYWHPLFRDRYLSVARELPEHVVIRRQFAFLGQVEEGADAGVEQGLEFVSRPRCARSAGVPFQRAITHRQPNTSPESVCAFSVKTATPTAYADADRRMVPHTDGRLLRIATVSRARREARTQRPPLTVAQPELVPEAMALEESGGQPTERAPSRRTLCDRASA